MSGIFSKVLFWFQAKNRHGIHSPFIYEFLDRAFYASPVKHGAGRRRLLRAAKMHFSPERVWTSTTLPPDSEILRDLNSDPTLQRPPFDLFVFENPAEIVMEILSDAGQRHNGSIVYLGNLRSSAPAYARWKEISTHPSVRVALETYWEGLLFFRKEQARQHFKIRT